MGQPESRTQTTSRSIQTFCTAHSRASPQFTMGRCFLRKIAPSPSHRRICTPSNTWFLGPTRVLNPNGISIDTDVLAGLTNVTDRPTDHATQSVITDCIYVRSTAMRSNLYIKIGSFCPSVCATVSASINPLPSDRLRCCDRYIRCQRSLAVKSLTMSGSPSHRGSVRRVSRYQFTHVRYRTAAAGPAR